MKNNVKQDSKGVEIRIQASTYENLKKIAEKEGLTIKEAMIPATRHFMNTKMKELG